TVVVADGNKLIQTFKTGDKEMKVVREFNGDEVLVTMNIGSATVSSDGFDSVLKELGLSDEAVAKMDNSTSSWSITKTGAVYTIKMVFAFMTREIQFELGKEFDDKNLDGSDIKGLIVADGNKLIQTSKIGDKVMKVVREYKGDEVIATATIGSATGVATYKRE
ncbi:unnamed protein product, partial [Medioppia subpectinata]